MQKEKSAPKELLNDDLIAKLERGELENAGNLLRKSGPSSTWTVKEYIRYFIFGGQPGNAQLYIKNTGVKLDWGKEKDVVAAGYDAIINRMSEFAKKSGYISNVEMDRIKLMGEIAGINISKSQNDRIVKLITDVPYGHLVSSLKKYTSIVGARISQETANKIYESTLFLKDKPSKRNLENAKSIMDTINIRPTGSIREKLLESYKRIGINNPWGVGSLKSFENYLIIFSDPADKKGIENLIKEDIPEYGKLALKLVMDKQLSEKETETLYLSIFEAGIMRHHGRKLAFRDIEYLKKYKLKFTPMMDGLMDKLVELRKRYP
ncbi:MAG: hypothetical protein KGI06_00300 [Candidatus Micrarchaeota archaeon]|nr:hypothetical protein [Candidatus Micrarchaeota archaeon]